MENREVLPDQHATLWSRGFRAAGCVPRSCSCSTLAFVRQYHFNVKRDMRRKIQIYQGSSSGLKQNNRTLGAHTFVCSAFFSCGRYEWHWKENFNLTWFESNSKEVRNASVDIGQGFPGRPSRNSEQVFER